MDLRLLKKLAFSSIEYGAMDETEKEICMDLMEEKWETWISSKARVEETGNATSALHYPFNVLLVLSLFVTIFQTTGIC
jgi:hypothetical protein